MKSGRPLASTMITIRAYVKLRMLSAWLILSTGLQPSVKGDVAPIGAVLDAEHSTAKMQLQIAAA